VSSGLGNTCLNVSAPDRASHDKLHTCALVWKLVHLTVSATV